MFKIDKSSVEYIDSNKSIVVIKQWRPKEAPEEKSNAPLEPVSKKTLQTEDPDKILKEARLQAEMLVQQAVNQVANIKQEAWQEGYANGMKEAQEKYQALCQENMAVLQKALQEVETAQQAVMQELQDCILQLSVEIAEKIVNIQLEKDDILFVGLVKQAITRLNPKEKFTVRVNQREFEKYFANGGEWLSNELQSPPFAVVKDSSLAPGGCVLESGEGVIKAGVDAQLKTIAMSLTERQYNEAL